MLFEELRDMSSWVDDPWRRMCSLRPLHKGLLQKSRADVAVFRSLPQKDLVRARSVQLVVPVLKLQEGFGNQRMVWSSSHERLKVSIPAICDHCGKCGFAKQAPLQRSCWQNVSVEVVAAQLVHHGQTTHVRLYHANLLAGEIDAKSFALLHLETFQAILAGRVIPEVHVLTCHLREDAKNVEDVFTKQQGLLVSGKFGLRLLQEVDLVIEEEPVRNP
mmetsp:Transcript_23288/g.43781  ORF Transcript_23288/g.43781 Transcript_23288/m.43781 type:complete len:218 (+) Transcript_23288:226-879(+)